LAHCAQITIKECHNEDSQCAFVVDKILETASNGSAASCSYGNIAILYRRQVKLTAHSIIFHDTNIRYLLTNCGLIMLQVSGKVFQMAFRERKVPFNIHGVAFYRKKVANILLETLSL
jgi:hypothetical protein